MGIEVLGAALISGGASYLSNKSAAKTAKNASNYAADKNAEVSREIYQQTRSDLSPYNQAGQAGLSALMQRLGLSPINTTTPAGAQVGGSRPSVIAAQGFGGSDPGRTIQPQGGQMNMSNPAYLTQGGAPTSPMSAPQTEMTFAQAKARDDARAAGRAGATPQAPAQPAGPDYAAYFAANPDLGKDASLMGFNPGDLTGDGVVNDADRGAWHYQNYGQGEGRQLPTAGGQAPAPGGAEPQYFQETYAQRPDALQVPTYQRPTDLAAPGNFSYTPQDIENDKGYQFALSQGLSAVNAGSAARGLLRSGDAAKALQDRGSGVAHQWDSDYFNRALQTYNVNNDNYRYAQGRQDQNFVDDRSYGTNLWNTQQNRQDNVFSDDRGFAANRNDQATSNLFGLVGVGQNAAAGTAAAGNVFAQNTINSNNQRAATTANAAIAGAQNTSNLFGSAANAVGTYYGMRGLR
jgi:hypothetical protein